MNVQLYKNDGGENEKKNFFFIGNNFDVYRAVDFYGVQRAIRRMQV